MSLLMELSCYKHFAPLALENTKPQNPVGLEKLKTDQTTEFRLRLLCFFAASNFLAL
ncbi:MAG: hypothetical protein HYR56_24125 [Acidobacteria bacterium]|nr:hypothetical protein [Acidobacteriota bacterium]